MTSYSAEISISLLHTIFNAAAEKKLQEVNKRGHRRLDKSVTC